MLKSCDTYLKILDSLRKKIRHDLSSNQIFCETGDWMDCAVLKLQKKNWTQNGIGEGVFFSVWIGKEELKKDRFNYNIHAFKLRLWKDHSIKPVEFASCFRSKLGKSNTNWPNLRTDYGPQTLMQGWAPLDLNTFEKDVSNLINEFITIHGIIDDMIDKRKNTE
jgi:hypothetical protein